jgi:hypothetical protein
VSNADHCQVYDDDRLPCTCDEGTRRLLRTAREEVDRVVARLEAEQPNLARLVRMDEAEKCARWIRGHAESSYRNGFIRKAQRELLDEWARLLLEARCR